jgi:Tol biopolymer transport system component
MNLWIVSLDGPGEATRLTTGKHWDADPLWFPKGNRIAFRSTRPDPGGNFQYLMTVQIDSESGRPDGNPRQISLEAGLFARAHTISPDGRWVAYVRRPRGEAGVKYALTVLPATGGRARVLIEQQEALFFPVWSTDGNIYFLSAIAPGDETAIRTGLYVERVAAEGGAVETLSTWEGISRAELSADAQYLVYRTTPRSSEDKIYEIASIEGQRLGSFSLPDDMDLITYTTSLRAQLLATTQDLAAPLVVLPINGGPARQLTETRAYDWPLGWTADSRAVVFESQLNGRKVLLAAPLDGGAMHQYGPQSDDRRSGTLSSDGRYVMRRTVDQSAETDVLHIVSAGTGEARELTRKAWRGYTWYNASGAGDNFLYAERKDGRFDFFSVHPEREPVLLRSFPDSLFPPIIGVRGSQIAYWVPSELTSTLYVATAGQPETREIITYPGHVGKRGSNEPVWSPDGHYLVTGYWRAEHNDLDALLLEFDDSGDIVGEPRVFEDLPATWWNLAWLPGSDGFLIVDGDVWLVSLDSGLSPVKLTDEESWPTWTYSLSPDGQFIAVAPEVRRGGAFWRLDFSKALEEASRR